MSGIQVLGIQMVTVNSGDLNKETFCITDFKLIAVQIPGIGP